MWWLLPGTIGILLSMRAISGLLSRLTMTAMVRRLGRQRLLDRALLVSGLAMCGIGLSHWPWLMGGLIMLIGFALGIGAPMTMPWVATVAPPEAQATAMAVRVSGNRVGQVVFPLGLGGIAGVLGPGAVFLFMAAALVAGALWLPGETDTQVP